MKKWNVYQRWAVYHHPPTMNRIAVENSIHRYEILKIHVADVTKRKCFFDLGPRDLRDARCNEIRLRPLCFSVWRVPVLPTRRVCKSDSVTCFGIYRRRQRNVIITAIYGGTAWIIIVSPRDYTISRAYRYAQYTVRRRLPAGGNIRDPWFLTVLDYRQTMTNNEHRSKVSNSNRKQSEFREVNS